MKASLKQTPAEFHPIDVVITIQNREDLAHFLVLWNMSGNQYKELVENQIRLWGSNVPEFEIESIDIPVSYDVWKNLEGIYNEDK